MRRLLPLVPVVVAAVVAAVLVFDGRDDGDGDGDVGEPAVEISSSAADVASLAELVAASDLVVIGTVGEIADGRTIGAADDPDAVLRSRLLVVDVARVLTGDAGGEVIVEEVASLADGTPVIVDGVEPVAVDTEAMWFLVAGDAETAPYYALVNRQGRYVVDGDGLVAASDDALSRRLAELGLDELVRRIAAVAAPA